MASTAEIEIVTGVTVNTPTRRVYEISAWVDGIRAFSPGAQVTLDRGATDEVTVGWSSSNTARTLRDADLQAQVMAAAVALAKSLVA